MAGVEHLLPKVLQCTVCKVPLPDSNALESHYMGKKHQRAVGHMDLLARQLTKTVYVSRLGQLRLPHIHDYLATFGTVVNMQAAPDKKKPGRLHHVIVEFEEEAIVKQVLNKSRESGHWVTVTEAVSWKHRIEIHKRQFRERRRSPSPPACQTLNVDLVKLKLSLISDCRLQLEELVSLCVLSPEEVAQRIEICSSLQETFRQDEYGYKDCVASPYGSSVNSLGFTDSDLDIYVCLGKKYYNFNNPTLLPEPEIPVTMSEQQQVKICMKMMKGFPAYARLHAIPQARVPILKFVHRETGINCDISFKNKASVANSKYIRLCVESNPKVRSLMVAVRYFAKVHDLAGGGCSTKLSNYALTLLVITFLQNLQKPLLHSVSELQSAPSTIPDVIDGWNHGIPEDFAQLRSLPSNTDSVLQLLAKFSHWVANLDFGLVVLCPRLGRVINKTDLTDKTFIHDVFPSIPRFMGEEDGLQIDTAICLQDPFEMSHNVCRNLHEKAVENLRRYFGAAAKLFHKMEEENEVDRPLGGLNAIFGLKVENGEKDGFWKIWEILKDEDKLLRDKFLFTIKLPLTVEFVGEFSRSQSGNVSSDMETWTDCAQHLISMIFRDVLKFETNKTVTELDKTGPDVDDKPNLETDGKGRERGTKRRLSPGRKNKKIKINYGEDAQWREGGEWVMWNSVWVSRKKKATSMEKDDTLCVLKWEEKISDLVLDGCLRLTQPEVSFQSNLLVWQRKPGEIHLWIGLVKISSRKKAFETMVDWLRAFLTETVSKHIRETLSTPQKVQQIQ